MGLGNLSLGTKLNLALLVFLLVLGVATSAIIIYSFNRTQDNANERSREALEEEGKLALQAVVGGIADSGALQLEYAAEVGQRASRYLRDFEAVGATSPYDVSRFDQTEDDVWYDPDPERVSDVVVPNHVPELVGGVLDDIAYSAPLDAIFPALAEGFPGQLSGDAFHPFAIIFVGVNGIGRYYPPIGVSETTPAELDISDFEDRFGPVTNPERESFWTPPYEDLQGRGLVITAQTPIYDSSDTFRGIFEVDLSIASLVEQVNELKPTPNGFTFYVDSEGEIMRTDAYGLLSREAERNDDLAAILASMSDPPVMGSPVVSEQVMLDGEEFFISHVPMLPIGGSIAVAAPVDEVTAQAATITAGIDEEGNRTFWIMLASMGSIFVAGLAGATYLNRRVLVAPIQRLALATRAVAAGNLETRVEPGRGDDELRELADSFNAMVEQLRESERLLERRVEERTRELEALLEVARAVSSTLDVEPLVSVVLDQMKTIVDYAGSSIVTFDKDGMQVVDSRGPAGREEQIIGLHMALQRGLGWYEEILAGRAVIIDDVRGDSPLALSYRELLGGELGAPAFSYIRSWMAVPLAVEGRTIGMLTLSHNEAGFFAQDHAALARAVADQAAIAIENARLYDEAQQVASLEERQRLARELHDSVSQALYGIALGARTARELLDREPAQAAEPVDYVLSLAEAGLAEMRALIFELRPESLETEGLIAALEKQVAATRARFAFDVESSLCDEPDVPIETKEALYRIGQEALHNVVKHAKAQHAFVSLQRDDGALTLAVRDDGIGFDTEADYAGHLGLRSMRERAAKVGGELIVESSAGSGTTVQVRVPAGGPP